MYRFRMVEPHTILKLIIDILPIISSIIVQNGNGIVFDIEPNFYDWGSNVIENEISIGTGA